MCFDRLEGYEEHADTLLERYDLTAKRNELVATLSKGMRQKLSVACAFIHDAKVLLFDEPMIGIDPAGAHELRLELKRFRDEGCSILISTHLLDTAEKLCDRVIILARGKMLAEGTLQELQSRRNLQGHGLEDVFLKLTGDSDAP